MVMEKLIDENKLKPEDIEIDEKGLPYSRTGGHNFLSVSSWLARLPGYSGGQGSGRAKRFTTWYKWSIESSAQSFPGCISRRHSACIRMHHWEGDSMGGKIWNRRGCCERRSFAIPCNLAHHCRVVHRLDSKERQLLLKQYQCQSSTTSPVHYPAHPKGPMRLGRARRKCGAFDVRSSLNHGHLRRA